MANNQTQSIDRSIVKRINKRQTINLLALALTLMLAIATSPISQAADGPTIDLNGVEPGIDYSATFVENMPGLVIVSADLQIEYEPNVITGAVAKFTNDPRPDSGVESLAIDGGVAGGLVATYSAVTGELTITGQATVDAYEQALRKLTYINTSESPDITPRTVEVTVRDGGKVSLPATVTITVVSVNDAPVLDPECAMTMSSIDEDSQPTNGMQVLDIINSGKKNGASCAPITDKDRDALRGFAIIGADTTTGQWQYFAESDTNWVNFPVVSNTSAVLLGELARIRFIPNLNFNGQAGFSIRAWDRSGGKNSGTTGVDVSENGDPTPFSEASTTVTVSIASVNDLPVVDLNSGGQGIDYTTQFFKGGSPVPIAGYQASITDPDHTKLKKLTITLMNRPDGLAESLATGVLPIGAVTIKPYDPATGMLVIEGEELRAKYEEILRVVTYVNSSETPSTADRTVTVVANDGIGDSLPATTTIKILQPNSAPVLDSTAKLTLAEIAEDTLAPPGAKIAQILGNATDAGGVKVDPITDPDSGALEGIAVIGAGADTSKGQWQYSLIDPPTNGNWLPIVGVTESAALLLFDSAWLRFVPAADYFGPADPLTFRAWDRTKGGNGQSGVDTTVNGGNTAFSVNTNSIKTQITPVNDPPLLGGIPTDPLTYEEANPTRVLALAGAATLTDPDSPNMTSATIQLTNPADGSAELLSVTISDSKITSTYIGGILQLTGDAPIAAYQEALRTVAYRNTSRDPDPVDRIINWSIFDGKASSTMISMVVKVQPVNDPPELDLDGIGPNLDFDAIFYINRGPVPIVAPSLVLIDHDNTTIKSATIRITNPNDGSAELLSADTTGTSNITGSYDPATGLLSLTGADSVANYQSVLRTVTYDNKQGKPNTEKRIVEFAVKDNKDGVSVIRKSNVSFVVAPTVHLFMPMTAWTYRRAEEPNNACSQAMEVFLNVDEVFNISANDTSDWFYFDLSSAANLAIELRDFLPKEGQIQISRERESGQGCGINSSNLERIGFSGDSGLKPNRTIELGQRPPGRYYIWIINDDKTVATGTYRLFVRTK